MVKDNQLAPVGVAHGRENSFWRGRLLLNTMEAQAYWTENVMTLEDSVDTWLLMLRQATVQQRYISPLMSANWVTRLLTTRSLGGLFLSSAKFEEYLRAHDSWSAREEDDLHFMVARLLMHHPDKPNTTMALEILRRHCESTNEALCRLLAPENPKGNGTMFLMIVELAQLLARQGSLREAHWALDFGRGSSLSSFRCARLGIMQLAATSVIGKHASVRSMQGWLTSTAT